MLSQSSSLQLQVELEANGLQLASDYVLEDGNSASALLKKLQSHRDAWLDLNLSSPITRTLGGDLMLLWELRDGVFAKATSYTGKDMEANSIVLFPLYNEASRTELRFEFPFDEFTIDLGQELVLLAGTDQTTSSCAWVRLCSSVTGQAHPQAQHPMFSVDLGFPLHTSVSFSLTLEIKGDLIAIKFAYAAENKFEILVWNWKTGILASRISCDAGIGNFVFLDPSRLIVWSACRAPSSLMRTVASLTVYELEATASVCCFPESGIFNISNLIQLAPSFVFQFPDQANNGSADINALGFLLRSDYGSQNTSMSPITVPFAHSRALTLGLTISVSDNLLTHFRIFVDTSCLIEHMARAEKNVQSSLNWEHWGEHATRWFRQSAPDHWICWMFGSRFVLNDNYLSVVDFNPTTFKRFRERQQSNYVTLGYNTVVEVENQWGIDNGSLSNRLSSDDFHRGDEWGNESKREAIGENAVVVDIVTSDEPTRLYYFDSMVTSRLPYRRVTRMRRVPPHAGWLISGNHLIGMSYDPGLVWGPDTMSVYTIGDTDGT